MNLENVTAELRPRGPWEAADLGVRMIRRDARAIYQSWFAITLPLLSLALLAIVFSPYPTVAAFVYWWLEPIADGPILHIISQRLFGEKADARAALRATGELAWRNKIFLISPYRFHVARSIAMPLTQLEGLQGEARRKRAKILNPRILNYGTGVTIAYQHLALALYGGIILLVFLLVPAEYQETIGRDWFGLFWQEEGRGARVLNLLLVYIAQSALQPWFIGAGFGLYINCRTQLEAWDIEVAFRRMVQRRRTGLATTLILALLIVPLALLPRTTLAEDTPTSIYDETATSDRGFAGFWTDDELRPALNNVMASDALKTTQEIETWQKIDQVEQAPETDNTSGNGFMTLIRKIGQVFSILVEFALWIGVALLLWFLIATRKHWQPYLTRSPTTAPSRSRVILSSGEITADRLPDDIPAETLRLWRAGQQREALSLLYRASVFAAVTRYGVRLPPSATEGICISAVYEQTDETQAAFFRKIVTAWTWCAYASREPADDTVLQLCREWPQHYGTQT